MLFADGCEVALASMERKRQNQKKMYCFNCLTSIHFGINYGSVKWMIVDDRNRHRSSLAFRKERR
jgi:hypothetical protein